MSEIVDCQSCEALRKEVERLEAEATRWRGAFHAAKKEHEAQLNELKADEDRFLKLIDHCEHLDDARRWLLHEAAFAVRTVFTKFSATSEENRLAIKKALGDLSIVLVCQLVDYEELSKYLRRKP